MRRVTCSACGSHELRTILDLGSTPIADAYTDTVTDPPGGWRPLDVAVCRECWLVQLLEVVPQDELFGTGYSFYTSASPPLSRYHETYARDVIANATSHSSFSSRRPVAVEIGCNDGDFLRHLAAAKKWTTIGVDPAAGPVKVARDRGLDVIDKPFTSELADQIVDELGHADVVIANHVLAHVEDVYDVLAGARRLLAVDGTAYVEVQYLPDLLLNNAFDLVYHEHRNFFSLTSLLAVARRAGLAGVGVRFTDRQGGSLRLTLRHVDGDRVPLDLQTVLSAERDLRHEATYAGLQTRAEHMREKLRDILQRDLDTGRRLIGYGAPAKATTLLNWCGLGKWLECVIDTTPAKQGRYVPGTNARIVPPEDVLLDWNTTVLLTAWNYQSTIIRSNGLDCRWVIPVPAPVVL